MDLSNSDWKFFKYTSFVSKTVPPQQITMKVKRWNRIPTFPKVPHSRTFKRRIANQKAFWLFKKSQNSNFKLTRLEELILHRRDNTEEIVVGEK